MPSVSVCGDLVEPVHRHADPLRQATELVVRQPAEPMLDLVELLLEVFVRELDHRGEDAFTAGYCEEDRPNARP